ncbi:Uncharacterized protein TCM_042779 [Theobroma cacao]|uniref:Uncharacterized protein n=1 Tax=Theobroma cacao TaxID=3641 RepID=A0A061FLM0_THECC|nr:Uncharacterized protein TCM_042779 [Theobroma cacao]
MKRRGAYHSHEKANVNNHLIIGHQNDRKGYAKGHFLAGSGTQRPDMAVGSTRSGASRLDPTVGSGNPRQDPTMGKHRSGAVVLLPSDSSIGILPKSVKNFSMRLIGDIQYLKMQFRSRDHKMRHFLDQYPIILRPFLHQ